MILTNRTIAAYMLWQGLDGNPVQIEESYQDLRKLVGMKPRDLELRRYRKVQSAMCNDSLAGTVEVLKLLAKKSPLRG